jgi:hypothetical protein
MASCDQQLNQLFSTWLDGKAILLNRALTIPVSNSVRKLKIRTNLVIGSTHDPPTHSEMVSRHFSSALRVLGGEHSACFSHLPDTGNMCLWRSEIEPAAGLCRVERFWVFGGVALCEALQLRFDSAFCLLSLLLHLFTQVDVLGQSWDIDLVVVAYGINGLSVHRLYYTSDQSHRSSVLHHCRP